MAYQYEDLLKRLQSPSASSSKQSSNLPRPRAFSTAGRAVQTILGGLDRFARGTKKAVAFGLTPLSSAITNPFIEGGYKEAFKQNVEAARLIGKRDISGALEDTGALKKATGFSGKLRNIALDIATDPTMGITGGVGKGAKIVGSTGRGVTLTAKGTGQFKDAINKAIAASGKKSTQLKPAELNALIRKTELDLVEKIGTGGSKGLVDKGGIKFADRTVIPGEFSTEPLGKALRFTGDKLGLPKLFNRDYLLRDNLGAKRAVQAFHDVNASRNQQFAEMLQPALKGLSRADQTTFALARSTGEKLGGKFAKIEELTEEIYKEYGKKLEKEGLIKGMLDDYVTIISKNPGQKQQLLEFFNRVAPNFRFGKPREAFETLAKAKAAGYDVETEIGKILTTYVTAANRALSKKELLKEFARFGVPAEILEGTTEEVTKRVGTKLTFSKSPAEVTAKSKGFVGLEPNNDAIDYIKAIPTKAEIAKLRPARIVEPKVSQGKKDLLDYLDKKGAYSPEANALRDAEIKASADKALREVSGSMGAKLKGESVALTPAKTAPADALKAEARKYKSAEEFTRSPRFEYHLSNEPNLVEGKTFAEQLTKPTTARRGVVGGGEGGVFSTNSPQFWHSQLSKELGRNAPKEVYLVEVKNPSPRGILESGFDAQASNPAKDVRVIRKLGTVDDVFDAGKFEELKKSQLTDLYNQAIKETPTNRATAGSQLSFRSEGKGVKASATPITETTTQPTLKQITNPQNVTPNGDVLVSVTDSKDLAGYKIPDYMVTYLREMDEDFVKSATMKGALKAYDTGLNFFRAAVTSIFPSFHARNAAGNTWQNYLDIGLVQTANPKWNLAALKVMSGKSPNAIVKIGGQEWKVSQLRQMMRDLQVIQAGTPFEVVGNVSKYNIGRRTARLIENEARATNFLANLERTGSPATAAERTKEFLFDYGNLSPFERNVLRRLAFFYQWPKKNILLQIEQFAKQPGKYTRLGIIQRELSENRSSQEKELLPDLTKADIGAALPTEDGVMKTLTGLQNPFTTAIGSVAEPFKYGVSQLNPLARAPFELAMGRSFRTGKEIRGAGADTNAQAFALLEHAPKSVQDIFGFSVRPGQDDNGQPDGTKKYNANPLAVYLLNNLSPSSRVTGEMSKLSDGTVPMSERLLRFTTGIRIDKSDIAKQVGYLASDYSNEIAKPYITQGIIKKGSHGYYVPNDIVLSGDEQGIAKNLVKALNNSEDRAAIYLESIGAQPSQFGSLISSSSSDRLSNKQVAALLAFQAGMPEVATRILAPSAFRTSGGGSRRAARLGSIPSARLSKRSASVKLPRPRITRFRAR